MGMNHFVGILKPPLQNPTKLPCALTQNNQCRPQRLAIKVPEVYTRKIPFKFIINVINVRPDRRPNALEQRQERLGVKGFVASTAELSCQLGITPQLFATSM